MLSKNFFSFSSPAPANELKLDSTKPDTIYRLSQSLNCFYQQLEYGNKPIIILCIGTDRSTGDSLGPLIGSKLKAQSIYPHIFGTLDEPVHATNLDTVLNDISLYFRNPFIIAVDACLGRSESVGFVTVGQGSLKPGAAVNKSLPAVGDIYITGTVNVGGFMEHMVLQSTRLSTVMKMADTIAGGLSCWLRSLKT